MSTKAKAPARKPDDLLTVAEVAAELRVSGRCVREVIRRGKLAAYRMGASDRGKMMVEWQEVQRYKRSRLVAGVPTTPSGEKDHLAMRGRRR